MPERQYINRELHRQPVGGSEGAYINAYPKQHTPYPEGYGQTVNPFDREGMQMLMQQQQQMPQEPQGATPYEDSSTPYGSFEEFLPWAYQLFMSLFHKEPGRPEETPLGRYVGGSIGQRLGEQQR